MTGADLRPMTLGEVLDRTFTLYKSNFWLFAGIMSLPLLLVFFVQVGATAFQKTAPAAAHAVVPSATIVAKTVGAGFAVLVVYFAIYAIAQAATIFAVSDLYLGRIATVRASFANVRGKALRAIGVVFLVLLMVGAAFFVLLIIASVLIALAPGLARSPSIFLIIVPVFIVLMIPAFILLIRTAVAVPAAMLEDRSAAAAIGRSMDLTKDFGMQMSLIFVLVFVLSLVASVVFQYPFVFITMRAVMEHRVVSFPVLVLQHLANFISSVLVGPIGTIAFCLMYYNLRVRKEAFDLQHLITLLPADSQPVSPVPGAPSAA